MLSTVTRTRAAGFGFTLCTSVLLSACGGGGGGGASTPSLYTTPSVNFTPFFGTFSAEGLSTQVILSQDADGNATGYTLAPSETRRVFEIKTSANPLTTAPDDAQRIQVTTPGTTALTDVTGTIQGNGAGQFKGYGDGTNQSVIELSTALKSSLGTTSLSYSYLGSGSIGVTTTNGSTTSVDGFVHMMFGGQKTVATDMPASGTATYTGAYQGSFLTATTGSPYNATLTDGSVAMTANFGAGTVNGRVDNYRNVEFDANNNVVSSSPISASIAFSGTVTGNAFSGTASVTQSNTNTPLAGYTQTGFVQGGFFGPQASEAAGAINTRATSGGTTFLSNGVFGAKKN